MAGCIWIYLLKKNLEVQMGIGFSGMFSIVVILYPPKMKQPEAILPAI
jgi:hypothetical protein